MAGLDAPEKTSRADLEDVMISCKAARGSSCTDAHFDLEQGNQVSVVLFFLMPEIDGHIGY